jgi:hypothetical protein
MIKYFNYTSFAVIDIAKFLSNESEAVIDRERKLEQILPSSLLNVVAIASAFT